MQFKIEGNIVDIINREIFPGEVHVEGGKIVKITRNENSYENYIMPGFIDAHVHIESSMLVPSEFARMASVHGTVATVSDPHEIGNVLGTEGVKFMIENASRVPFKIYFGAPSCVPATGFETSGATITAENIEEMFAEFDLKYLSEMMNFPGVLIDLPEVKKKIQIAKKFNKPVDGHAPGLKGEDAKKYIEAGITTDHECFSLEEAEDKIKNGMKILIREGSAAKNYNALHSLITKHTEMCMLCSDDKHPDDLAVGHINKLAARAVVDGHDKFDVLQAAILNPREHYSLDTGLLREGDPADFIVVDNLLDFNCLENYINGELVAENGTSKIPRVDVLAVNNFACSEKSPGDFSVAAGEGKLRVIEALNGEIITGELFAEPKIINGKIECDTENDILKIAVINRYSDAAPAVAFIKNFGLKKGAIASSVGHDSHNIIAVGTSDVALCEAVNAVIREKGGLAAHDGKSTIVQPLPVAGLMSADDGRQVAKKYMELDAKAKEMGTGLDAPFMTLSFMALLVIPSLKLSDLGLFDGNKFEFTSLQAAGR
jgi:adenine deaminase